MAPFCRRDEHAGHHAFSIQLYTAIEAVWRDRAPLLPWCPCSAHINARAAAGAATERVRPAAVLAEGISLNSWQRLRHDWWKRHAERDGEVCGKAKTAQGGYGG